MTEYFGTEFAEDIAYQNLDAEPNIVIDESFLEKIAFAVSEAYLRTVQTADEERRQAIVYWTKHHLRLTLDISGNTKLLDYSLSQSLRDTIENFLELDNDFQWSVRILIESIVHDIDDNWLFLLELIMELTNPEKI